MSNTSFQGGYYINDAPAPVAIGGGSFRNKVINGCASVDQRRNGGSNATGGGVCMDRWYASSETANRFTVQQNAGSVTPPPGFSSYIGITSNGSYSFGSDLYDTYLIYQRIEGSLMADFMWGTSSAKAVVLSFWARSSLTGTFGGAINTYGAGTSGQSFAFTYNIPVANTWTKCSVSIPAITAGTWATGTGAGATLIFGLGSYTRRSSLTANAWSPYTSWPDYNLGNTEPIQPTGTVSLVSTNGATLYLTGIQLEIGTTASDYEARPLLVETQLCQRYFQNIVAWWGVADNTSSIGGYTKLAVPMRANPTTAKVSGSTLTWRTAAADNSSTSWAATFNASWQDNTQIWFQISSVTGNLSANQAVTARGYATVIATADADLS